MNKQKQIEEMARSVCRTPNCKAIVCADLKEKNAQPCDKRCRAYTYATRFYNAGYRKASEVANDIFREIEKHSHITFINGNEDNPLLLVDYEFYNELKANIQREKENGL